MIKASNEQYMKKDHHNQTSNDQWPYAGKFRIAYTRLEPKRGKLYVIPLSVKRYFPVKSIQFRSSVCMKIRIADSG